MVQDDNRRTLKSIIFVLIGIIVFIVMLFTILLLTNVKKKNVKDSKDSVIDNSELKEDYYAAANKEILDNMKIPSQYSSWSLFHDAQLEVNIRKEDMIDEIINSGDFSNENMEIMVELYKDYSGRNKRGLSELEPYFEMIDNAKTMEEFNKALIVIDHYLNSNAFLSIGVQSDLYNTSKNVLYFYPILVEDYYEIYTLPKYERFKEMYEKFRRNVLELAGWKKADIDKFCDEIDAFVSKIQSKSINITEVTNKLDLYNKYTYEDVVNNLVNLPVVDFLKRYGLEDQEYYVFYDMEHYKALDALFTIDNLEFLKKYEKLLILERVAVVYTTDDFFDLGVELYNDSNASNISSYSKKEEYISDLKESSIGEELAIAYEEKYFTDKDKEFVLDLVEEIREYYKEVIENCEWLDSSTKKEALKKLESMKVNVGYIKKESNVEDVKYVSKKDGGTLISNYILSNRNSFDKIVDELNMETDGSVAIDTFEVNAYYNPLDNSINFTAAFKEMYSNEDDYYKILGYVGTVVGHEMSHAFDYTGSKFDENGNVRDWWTNKDKERYEDLTSDIINYYNNYSVGKYNVDGEKTLSENIADLASMKCMISIMEKKGASVEDYKHFFESYAHLWASKETDEALENQILTDSHAPNKVRVNAVLSSTDKFYEIYDINEDNDMFVPKNKRVGLW